jgi:hypothetical protein
VYVPNDATLDQLDLGKDAVINLIGILAWLGKVAYGPEFARAHANFAAAHHRDVP